MAHVPHLLLEAPWDSQLVEVSEAQAAHLERVLRLREGDPVSYTDGLGTLGEGRYQPGLVVRGGESTLERPTDLVVVVAPPSNRDRARFMIEKLSEMGVAEVRFLETRHGQGRPPRADRLRAWAVAGLEQSAGVWLMRTSTELVTLSGLDGPVAVCEQGGSKEPPHARTVVIGPEGGWAPGEVPEEAILFDLGDTILRVETAAVVAAARMS
ncbi:MAG TPA: 16S rRNA (uracil(1498)-N(3))-methyltransferase [Acidimicrobiia bacterium]|nr:16S rRNA (uracil(1498)-N(3))-methyltransferase [Acidimicrobiia bacterium]